MVLVATCVGTPAVLRVILKTKRLVQVKAEIVGLAVAQLVETLRYKSEGRGFDGVTGIFH